MPKPRVVLPGSHRNPLHGHQILGGVDTLEWTHVTLVLRRKKEVLPITPYGAPMRPMEYTDAHGATATDFLAVREFAEEYGLNPLKEKAASRTIELHGHVGDLSRAFGVTLQKAQVQDVIYRQRTGDITIWEDLIPTVQAVLGLDDRPAAAPHCIRRPPLRDGAADTSLSPLTVAQLYDFPAYLSGTGQTIAIIALDGGFLESDLDAWFKGLGIPRPAVGTVLLDGQINQMDRHLPGHPELNADEEVALAIQTAGAIAPGAKQIIYFAQNTDQSFLNVVSTAIHGDPQPTVIYIGWGNPESSFSLQAMRAFDSALQDAANLGIPVCVAAGNDGAFKNTTSLQVDFPASAPHALGCGGARLGTSNGTLSSETVWNWETDDESGNRVRKASGGGVSRIFAKPSYQAEAAVPDSPQEWSGGRGVPDVAANADPETGYRIRVKGSDTVVGGTSAAAALWAGLIARFGQAFGSPVGFLHPQLYKPGIHSSGFHDIVSGDKDHQVKGHHYRSGAGWDCCTGLGRPVGSALLQALGCPHFPDLPQKQQPVAPPRPKPTPQAAPPRVPVPPRISPAPPAAKIPKPVPAVQPVLGGQPALPFHPATDQAIAPLPAMQMRMPVPATVAPGEVAPKAPIELPPPQLSPMPAPVDNQPGPNPALLQNPAMLGANPVAITGVIGLAAITGALAAAGVVALAALGMERAKQSE